MMATQIEISPVRMDRVTSTGSSTYSSEQWLDVVLATKARVKLPEGNASPLAASARRNYDLK